MTIYYLPPDYPLTGNIEDYTKEQLDKIVEMNDCFKLTPKAFERAFNNEQISDLGYIRIFK